MVEQGLPEPQHRLRLPCYFDTIDGRQHLGRWLPGEARDGKPPLLIAAKPPEHMVVDNMARKAQPRGLAGDISMLKRVTKRLHTGVFKFTKRYFMAGTIKNLPRTALEILK